MTYDVYILQICLAGFVCLLVTIGLWVFKHPLVIPMLASGLIGMAKTTPHIQHGLVRWPRPGHWGLRCSSQ